jgi:hypothetical protein
MGRERGTCGSYAPEILPNLHKVVPSGSSSLNIFLINQVRTREKRREREEWSGIKKLVHVCGGCVRVRSRVIRNLDSAQERETMEWEAIIIRRCYTAEFCPSSNSSNGCTNRILPMSPFHGEIHKDFYFLL